MKFFSRLTARANQSPARRSLHNGQAASHRVAEDGSPRREPWEKIRARQKPRQGRQHSDQRGFSFAPTRLLSLLCLKPTADAVGYPLALLRSYLPPFSRTDLIDELCVF